MFLVYIENNSFLSKIVTYLDYGKIDYTFDINSKYDKIIIAQNSSKTLELMKQAKKIIYIMYLDELKYYNNYYRNNKRSNMYISNMKKFFSYCNIIITSLPFFKKIVTSKKVYILPLENIYFSVCKNKLLNFGKKTITIIDSNYKYLNNSIELINKYPNYQFNLIGFNSNLKKSDLKILSDIPCNVTLYKYCNDILLNNYIVNSMIIVSFDSILDNNYINICLNMKKNILLLNSKLYSDYFVDNKNIYLFDSNDILKKFNKIISNRVSNLGGEGYNLICNNNFKEIADKFCKLIK